MITLLSDDEAGMEKRSLFSTFRIVFGNFGKSEDCTPSQAGYCKA